jgi:hypothetical protein
VAQGFNPAKFGGSVLRYVEDAGARHTEAAWAWRLDGALEFLLS